MPSKVKTISIKERPSKVNVAQFGSPFSPDQAFNFFLESWPDILAAKDFRELVATIKRAARLKKPVIVGMGAHVIKVGLNSILIDLMERGLITALALNGAGIIHDFEIAYCGQTSEDVASQIESGSFGMAKETAEFLNQAIRRGAEKDSGLGEAVGEMIYSSDFPYKNLSLLATAFRLNLPATVHVAVGTDVIHMHPQASGEAIGKT